MSSPANERVRELRQILGQTQDEFAAMIGASKDTVVSWETGRNRVSAGMARRISLVTGVEEKGLSSGKGPLLTRGVWPRRPFTVEEFKRHQERFWGGSLKNGVRLQLDRCQEALELLLNAAVTGGEQAGLARLTGLVDAFNQWCQEAREDFGLGEQIDAQLAKRKQKLEFNRHYAQWRQMAKEDPEMARKMGFKDDPKRGDEEMLRLSIETVPVWMPGQSMRGGRG